MDFDIFLKLKVLHQLSVWTFWNPDRIKEKMPEQREIDQTQWVRVLTEELFDIIRSNLLTKCIAHRGTWIRSRGSPLLRLG